MDLSLPHDTINISVLLPKVQASIEGIDQNLAAEYLMDAAIEFAKDSHVMRKTLCIDVLPCVTSYKLDLAPYRLFQVLKVVYNTDQCVTTVDMSNSIRVEGSTLYLNDEPDTAAQLIIEIVAVPMRGGEFIPADVYEDWEPAIINLALSNLYLMAGATWGNKGLSDRTRQLYQDFVKRARFITKTRHKPVSLRLSPKWRMR